MWIGLAKNQHPKGEVGVLKEIAPEIELGRCFLTIEYENEPYIGCLYVKYSAFCKQLCGLLQHHIGDTVREIGDLDVSDTF